MKRSGHVLGPIMDSRFTILIQTLSPDSIRELGERLAARTKQGPSCWEIQGAAVHGGYVHIGVVVGGRQKLFKAHRVAWELANGPIPDGMRVLHACDNPRCVNPNHLSLGTQADNIRDSVQKGRFTAWHRTGLRLNGTPAN